MVNGSESDVVKFISGVSQGSVLGPLLFLIYVNDLCTITLSHGSKVTMYVDDLVLYKVIDTESAHFCLQEDINNIVQWARSNLMNLNYSKCKIMLLSRKHHSLPPLFLESEKIEQVLTYKYLGLVLTTSLECHDHINKKLLGYLYQVFYRNVQPSFLCHLFTFMIWPILRLPGVGPLHS